MPKGRAKEIINKTTMKKFLTRAGLGLATIAVVVAGAAAFSAFEAHVINVTAKIENALTVPVEPIRFGTVFPQEQLDGFLPVSLSQSFQDERNADDVNYIIRQKPKCGVVHEDTGVVVPSWTGHVIPNIEGAGYTVDCEKERPITVPSNPNDPEFYLLPSLCPYLSKHEMTDDLVGPQGPQPDNDGSLAAFHQPFEVVNGLVVWNDVKGRLAKSEQDTADTWKIDLKVPCFGGYCAQDWEKYVLDINPGAVASDYVQDIENEHKVFGCNLWVEVTGVSRSTTPLPIPGPQ